MQNISNLNPSEAVVLLDPENVTAQEIIRFTISELVAEKVFEFYSINQTHNLRKGIKYNQSLKPYQNIFREAFKKFQWDPHVPVRVFVEELMRKVGKSKKIKNNPIYIKIAN